ncbi:hypothetical protein P7B02_11375 [Caulobacter segnis]|uniref:hypothetical protein n=1 Tax=Caulobacter segnis TaxID=88688 RepID=UPI00240EB6CA|nr:hypothetical protein [Caulobacter segnis]MDG2522141.1 hypothetical protein [Caulobacter segnis]
MVFSAGERLVEPVTGDPSREAIASIRGYAYQIYLSALAWMDLKPDETLHLEVAEDYAVATRQALDAVQVKDTAASASLTLRHGDVIAAIDSLVDLIDRNPSRTVRVRFLSTAEIGLERAKADRPSGIAGLEYWRKAAAGADVAPLRKVLDGLALKPETKEFIDKRNDVELREDMLSRIHWDVGRPDMATVQQEFDLALLSLGSRHELTPQEARQLGDTLLVAALRTVIEPGLRALSASDLTSRVEAAATINLPRRQMETLLAQAQGRVAAAPRPMLPSLSATPLPSILAHRTLAVGEVLRALGEESAAWIHGGTGTGKSLLVRLGCDAVGGDWRIADLYNLEGRELEARLDELVGVTATNIFDGIVLDDLNDHTNPSVERGLARLIAALRRRDRRIVITSYTRPSARVRDAMGLRADSEVLIGHLSVAEVAQLVADADGDPDLWTRKIYLASGPGHPQLVQALIADLRRRRWTAQGGDDLTAMSIGDLALGDERDAARRRLIRAAAPDARNLINRLGLMMGRFDRSMAIELAALPPPIPDAGAHIDGLIGPWIDRLADGKLRLSPLLIGCGAVNLTQAEQSSVHSFVADRLTPEGGLDVTQVGVALVHALAAPSPSVLTKIALAILGTSINQLPSLSTWLMPLRALKTDGPIFPADLVVSQLLRLAQLIVEAEAPAGGPLGVIWEAFERESAAIEEKRREQLEVMALSKILMSKAFARDVPDWVTYLSRFASLMQSRPDLEALVAEYKAGGKDRPDNILGFMFMNLAMGVPSVDALEHTFNLLDRLPAERRRDLLAGVNADRDDRALLVSRAWVADNDKGTLDAAAAAGSYARMATMAETWKEPALAQQALIAQAVMYDEYLEHKSDALAVLKAAEEKFGSSVAISRARAKLFYRGRNHAQALELIESFIDDLQGDGVERAFVLREAGICAGELGRFSDARQWFEAAHLAASNVNSETMAPMAVGLLADAAVAASREGDPVEAVGLMARSLEGLERIDPESSLRAKYVHRVVGHATMCLCSSLTGTSFGSDEDQQVPSGSCSNPDPDPDFATQPVAPIEAAWYLIAEADEAIGGKAGQAVRLEDRLKGKVVLECEALAARRRVDNAAICWDMHQLARAAEDYLRIRLWLSDQGASRPEHLEAVAGPIPAPGPNAAGSAADLVDGVLVYVLLTGALSGRTNAIATVQEVSRHLHDLGYPEGWQRFNDERTDRAAVVVGAWRKLADQQAVAPAELFVAGFYLLGWLENPAFKEPSDALITDWARRKWSFVLQHQRFALLNPSSASEAIEKALASDREGGQLLADVLIAAAPYVDVVLGEQAMAYLRDRYAGA